MKTLSSSALLSCILVGVAGAAAGQTTFDVSVRVHRALELPSDDYMRRVLARASQIYETSDGADDILCGVQLQLDGSVGFFSETEVPFHIDSERAFAKVGRAPGTVKIVGDISWCGSLANNIAGCANVPGVGLAARLRGNVERDAMVIAHEFSHLTGSQHRNAVNALLRPVAETENTWLNRSECLRLASGPNAVIAGDALSLNSAFPDVHGEAHMAGDPEGDVLAFVSKPYEHGTPYVEAIQFGESDVPTLVQALEGEDDPEAIGNIVSTLGAIGTDSARQALIDYLLADRTLSLSASELVARASVLNALGWLVNRTGDNTALELLLNASNTDWWVEVAQIEWENPVYPDARDLAKYLVSKAIVGLTLSGMPEARRRLEILQAGVDPSRPQPIIAQDESLSYRSKFGAGGATIISFVSPGTIEAIEEAGGADSIQQYVNELTTVQSQGLIGYYD